MLADRISRRFSLMVVFSVQAVAYALVGLKLFRTFFVSVHWGFSVLSPGRFLQSWPPWQAIMRGRTKPSRCLASSLSYLPSDRCPAVSCRYHRRTDRDLRNGASWPPALPQGPHCWRCCCRTLHCPTNSGQTGPQSATMIWSSWLGMMGKSEQQHSSAGFVEEKSWRIIGNLIITLTITSTFDSVTEA